MDIVIVILSVVILLMVITNSRERTKREKQLLKERDDNDDRARHFQAVAAKYSHQLKSVDYGRGTTSRAPEWSEAISEMRRSRLGIHNTTPGQWYHAGIKNIAP